MVQGKTDGRFCLLQHLEETRGELAWPVFRRAHEIGRIECIDSASVGIELEESQQQPWLLRGDHSQRSNQDLGQLHPSYCVID